jgi:hypothetical protein
MPKELYQDLDDDVDSDMNDDEFTKYIQKDERVEDDD